IIYVSGTVKVKTPISPDWIDAQEGMIVKAGDVIKTDADSRAELAFGERLDNIINVFPSSQLVISSLDQGLVKLEEGRVFSLIKKLNKGSTFEVRTPTAVAGARGTGWGTGFLNSLTQVQGFEKSVYVAGLDENNNLSGLKDMPEGFGTSVPKRGGPAKFFRLSEEEIQSWRAWLKEARSHLDRYKEKKGQGGEAQSEKLEKAESRSRVLERVERETTRTEEIRRDRRTRGGSSGGKEGGPQY
ncbi:MAG: FecR family protein, partial [Candidatus Omnitrophota bacterium]